MSRCKSKKPCSRDFDEQIVFTQLTQAKNDTGGYEVTRSTFATCSAGVTPRHGRESVIAGRIDPVDFYKIMLRYLPGLNESMEIEWDGRTLQIESIILFEGKKDFYSIIARDEGPGT